MTVSIIIPVYNVEKYLERCLSCVRSQTFEDFEVLIIDDGSSDSSGKIADLFAEDDNRFKVFHRDNHGVSATRNFGLDNASGEFVSFIDADDSVCPDFLEKLVAPHLEKRLDFTFCDILLEQAEGNVEHIAWQKGADKDESLRNFFLDGWCGTCYNKIYRRSFIEENHLRFSEDIRYCEDVIFNVQILTKATDFEKIHAPLYLYNRINTESATHIFNKRHEADAFTALETITEYLKEEGLWEQYGIYIEWRILLNKIGIAFDKTRLRDFNRVHPEVNAHIWTNPFLHTKLRILMTILRYRLYGIAKLILFYNENSSVR